MTKGNGAFRAVLLCPILLLVCATAHASPGNRELQRWHQELATSRVTRYFPTFEEKRAPRRILSGGGVVAGNGGAAAAGFPPRRKLPQGVAETFATGRKFVEPVVVRTDRDGETSSPDESTSTTFPATTMGSSSSAAADTIGAAPAEPRGISYHWNDPQNAGLCASGARYCGVLTEPIAVYVLWYGRFSDAQKQIMRTFIQSLNENAAAEPGVPTVPKWWAITTRYYDSLGRNISSSVTLAGEADDAGYSKGSTLYNSDIESLIVAAVKDGTFPRDPNGVYFVMSDENVAQVDDTSSSYDPMTFCGSYCGWHSFTREGSDLIISFVGNAVLQCPDGCIAPYLNQYGAVSPNGDKGLDGMVSVFAHELAEAASSPFLATWYDDSGEENADICAKKYGDVLSDPTTGAPYNVEGVGGSKFIVQANMDPTTGRCEIQATGSNDGVTTPTPTTPTPTPVPTPTTPTPTPTVPEPPVTSEPPVVETPPTTVPPSTNGWGWGSIVDFIKNLFGW
eukprot:TRINITY_DN6666_c0_g1_i2.p1 TRINITY_DN6666_c0_g1~~TRINITY_DN6666_c0_g1_i2.p1  ORF type:complete len:528 (-),score=-16.40 TRINITY_DN6666_c0_g1_i2:122-1645(-)